MGRRSPREKSKGESGRRESGGEGELNTSWHPREDGANPGASDDVEDADDVEEHEEFEQQLLRERAVRPAVRLAKVSTFRGPWHGSVGKVNAGRLDVETGAVAGGEYRRGAAVIKSSFSHVGLMEGLSLVMLDGGESAVDPRGESLTRGREKLRALGLWADVCWLEQGLETALGLCCLSWLIWLNLRSSSLWIKWHLGPYGQNPIVWNVRHSSVLYLGWRANDLNSS